MRVSKFKIKNLFGIKEFETSGQSIEITGDNGTGKTSIIDSFRLALKNRSDRDFIIRKGQEEGEVIIETDSGLRVQRKMRTTKGDYKSIKSGSDKKEQTEGFLRSIFTELQLNPIEFAQYPKDEQNRIVLDLIEFEWDLNWIKKQFGEVVPDVNYEQNILCVLHDIQADEGYYFTTRQDINREARNKKAFSEEIGQKLPTSYNADEWENKSVGELWKKVERIRNENNEIEKAKAIVENRDNKVRKFQADYEIEVSSGDREIQGEENTLKDNMTEWASKIREAQNQLEVLKGKKEEKRKLAKANYEKNTAQFDGEVKEHLETAKKEIQSFAETQEEAEHIESMKAHINQYKDMVRYQEEVEKLQSKSQEITEKIEHARTLPAQILEDCEIPVDGLTVENGIPLIKGLPISNLSEGEKFDLCIDIATKKEGSLNMVLLDGVEKWSKDSRERNYKKLKDRGVLFIATRTTDDKDLMVAEL